MTDLLTRAKSRDASASKKWFAVVNNSNLGE